MYLRGTFAAMQREKQAVIDVCYKTDCVYNSYKRCTASGGVMLDSSGVCSTCEERDGDEE